MRSRRGYWERPTLTAAFESIRADYDAAKETRFRRRVSGVVSSGSGADYHYRSEGDYLRMMEIARAIYRNDLVVGQAIRRLKNNVLQGGVRLDPDTGDDGLDTEIRERWKDWGEDPDQCDIAGENTFHQMSGLAFEQWLVDGDHFGLPMREGSLQLVEAHRCRTPRNTQRNVVHGVLMNPMTRKRLEYWFTKEDVNPNATIKAVGDMFRWPAREADGMRRCFQVYDPRRSSQTRGVTCLAPTVNAVSMIDEVNFAKLVQAQVTSFFAILREREMGGQYGEPEAIGSETSETRDDGTSLTIEEMAPGMEWIGQPGEKLSGFSPNVPNQEYFAHVKLILQFIAINLDMPVQVLLLDPSETNFSGWRGAIDQARIGWQQLQRVMIERWYRPSYKWKLAWWLATDTPFASSKAVKKVGARLWRHAWCPPYWPYIEPEKDAKADTLIIDSRLNSRREVLNRRGVDIEDVDRDAVDDQARYIGQCMKAAKAINKKNPDDEPVTWRDVAELVKPEAKATAKATTDSADSPDGKSNTGSPQENTKSGSES